MNKVYLLSAFLSLAVVAGKKAKAQQPQEPIGMVAPDAKMLSGSPAANSLSSIYAPNLFDGSTNVNIPVYQFSHDNASYGISLSYNTKGVKVDEVASPAGLHWNINAYPTIARIVHDLPDELNVQLDSLIRDQSKAPLFDSVVNKEMYVKGRLAVYRETTEELARPNAYQDGESDEFIVSLGGGSFSFYIGKDLKIFTSPHRNVTIKLLIDGQQDTVPPELPMSIMSAFFPLGDMRFIITDEQGTRYYFREISNQSIPSFNFLDWRKTDNDYEPCPAAIAWAPDKIVFADGNEIDYTYGDIQGNANAVEYNNQYYSFSGSSVSYNGMDVVRHGDYSWTHSLSSIQYPNGVRADFIYDPLRGNGLGVRMLSQVRIASGNNCLRYQLYQDTVKGRWFLDSINMLSCDSSLSEPYYSFTYKMPQLPPRLSAGQDFFGYYNGDTTTPSFYNGAINYNNSKHYHADKARAGLLSTVNNAYGGQLRFYYGANTITSVPIYNELPVLDNNFTDLLAMDGVRVDTIITKDKYHPEDSVLTAFDYSNGQVFLAGGYFHYPENINTTTGQWTKGEYQGMFLTPHQLINGSNHGYSNVSIRTYGSDGMLSRRDITFSNMLDATSGNEPRYYKAAGSKDYFEYPYTDKQYLKDWEIGLPLMITDYDQDDHIVQRTIHKYDFSFPMDSAYGYVDNVKTIKVDNGGSPVSYTDAYYPFTGWAPLDTTISQKYVSDSRYVSDTAVYAYDDHHNLSSSITQTSKGERIATSMVYNYDIDGPDVPYGSPHPGTTLYSMSDSGLEKVVSSERWLLHPSTQVSGDGGGVQLLDNDLLLHAYITGYRYQDGKLWTGSLWNTKNGSPLTHTQYTGLIGSGGNPYGKALDAYNDPASLSGFRQSSRVKLFDEKGNPLETQLLGQNQFKAMIWNAATGQKLADAANCHYSDIAYSSFEDIYRFSTLEPVFRGNLKFNRFACTPDSSLAFTAMSGSHVYKLAPGQTGGVDNDLYDTASLSTGKEYILSFWVYGSLPPVYLGQTALTAPDPVYSKGSWHNYQFRFTASGSGKLHIAPLSFATVYLDEIRLYPAGAQMQSNTYEPLFGISSRTDASGRITYYEYDAFGRQTLVRDQDGNILSRSVYTIGR